MNSIAPNKFAGTYSKSIKFGKLNISGSYIKLNAKSPVIDILNDFKWKNWGKAEEVPAIYAQERELSYSVFTNSILTLLQQGKSLFSNEGLDIYAQLYKSEPTGFNYVFPYLVSNGNSIRQVQNQWVSVQSGVNEAINNLVSSGNKDNSKNNNDGGGLISSLVGIGINTGMGYISPGWGMEELLRFDNTARQTLPITFPLYNTGDIEDIYANLSFINVFTYQNLKNRTSIMTYIPPKIYTVDAKSIGGIYMPVAYVSDLKVESIGTTRRVSELKKYGIDNALIPEAYKVTISFTELLPQSANIFIGSLGGDKVTVTSKSGSSSGGGQSKDRNSQSPQYYDERNSSPNVNHFIAYKSSSQTPTEVELEAQKKMMDSLTPEQREMMNNAMKPRSK